MSSADNTIHNAITDFHASTYADIQYSPPQEIQEIQTQLLLNHIEYAATHSPFYKILFRDHAIDYRDIKTMADLSSVPFTRKSDMTDKSNDFLAVSEKDIVDVCLTSATTGSDPTVISQTQSDLARLAYNEEVAFAMAGITDDDTLLVCAALDRCFMAGLAYFLGGVRLNARVLRGGAGSAAQHWHLMKTVNTTAIVGVPSLMAKIARYAMENGDDPSEMGVKKLVAIGEPVRDAQLNLIQAAQTLEKHWNAKIFSTYASSELATTFCECPERRGGHLRPELIVLEIVDDDGRPVPAGETGEVVVTPMGITGMPLIRFKTGDISYIIETPCACGRKTSRLAPILGRKNQMLKYKGTTIFPNAIIAALEGNSKFYGGYVEAKKNDDGTDRIILHAAMNTSDATIKWLQNELRAKIRVVPEIILAEKKAVDKKVYRFEKKRKRITFFDLR